MIAGVIIALSLVGVVVGAILYQKEIGMQVTIVGAEIELYEDDKLTPKTLIDFGEALVDEVVTIGKEMEGERIWLINQGDVDVNVYWSASCPIGNIYVQYATIDFQDLLNGTLMTIGAEWMMRFTLLVDGEALRGSYEWTLTFLACDASGP